MRASRVFQRALLQRHFVATSRSVIGKSVVPSFTVKRNFCSASSSEADSMFDMLRHALSNDNEGFVNASAFGGQFVGLDGMQNAAVGQLARFDNGALAMIVGLNESNAIAGVLSGALPRMDEHAELLSHSSSSSDLIISKPVDGRVEGLKVTPLLNLTLEVVSSSPAAPGSSLFSSVTRMPKLGKVFERKGKFENSLVTSQVPLVDVCAPIYQGHAVEVRAADLGDGSDESLLPLFTARNSSSANSKDAMRMMKMMKTGSGNSRQQLINMKSRAIQAAAQARQFAYLVAETAARNGSQDVILVSTRLDEAATASRALRVQRAAEEAAANGKGANAVVRIVHVSPNDSALLRQVSPIIVSRYINEIVTKRHLKDGDATTSSSSSPRPCLVLFDGLEDLAADEASLINLTRESQAAASHETAKKKRKASFANNMQQHHHSASNSVSSDNDLAVMESYLGEDALIVPPPLVSLTTSVNSLLASAGSFTDGRNVTVMLASTAREYLTKTPGSAQEAQVVKAVKQVCADIQSSVDVHLSLNHEGVIDAFDLHTTVTRNSGGSGALVELTAEKLKTLVDATRQQMETSRLNAQLGLHEDFWETEDLNSNLALLKLLSAPLVSHKDDQQEFAAASLPANVRSLLLARAAVTLYVPSVMPHTSELVETANLIERLFAERYPRLVSRLIIELEDGAAAKQEQQNEGVHDSRNKSTELVLQEKAYKEQMAELLDEVDDAIASLRTEIPICRPILA